MDPNNPWKNEGFTPQIMGKKNTKNEGNVGSHGSVNIPVGFPMEKPRCCAPRCVGSPVPTTSERFHWPSLPPNR